MKKLISILSLTFVLFSCSKDDETTPQQVLVKVIDKIEVQRKYINSPTILTHTTKVDYNQNKEINKIQLISNNSIEYSSTFEYQNNRPVTSTIITCCEPAYQVAYSYNNDIFAGWSSVEYGNVPFDYYPENHMYINVGVGYGNNTYFMSPYDDITVKATDVEYAYEFVRSHKGPLYNVVNKKWISLFWQFGQEPYNVLTTYPYISIYDETNSQLHNVTSEYEGDNFIKNYKYTIGDSNYEVIFTYKYI